MEDDTLKRIYIFRIILFIIILVVPIITINLKPNQISEIDNKKFMEISDIFEGDLTDNIETFIGDRIGFRTSMINAYTIGMDVLFNYMVHPSYEYGQDGYVFTKIAAEDFNSEYQDIFSDYILKLQNYCNDRDIKFLYVIEPSKSAVYSEYLPTGLNAMPNDNLNYFLNLLDEKNINHVYTGDDLIKYKSHYQVFDKKYDANHWNETGAIIGISSILDRLNEMDSTVDKLNINNFNISTVTHTTLPVSYFPINEESTIYELKDDTNIETISTFNDKIKISEQFRNFSHYINKSNPDAPKILVFAGSYFSGKLKFLTNSFSELILVHNYYNILNTDYYINLFNPDIVLFESSEQTHNSYYFNSPSMRDITFNKSLLSYSDLSNTQYATINGNIEINDNGSVTDFSIPLNNGYSLYSYALIGDRILDCRTISDDNGIDHIEFSITSSELENINEFTLYTISNDEKEYSEIKINLE